MVYGQNRKVSAIADSSKIRIGSQFVLRLEASYPAQDKIEWPIVNDTLGGFEVLQQTKIDTSYDPNNITTKLMRQNLLLTSFDSGYLAIPALQFKINDTIYESEAILIQVATIEIDTSKGIADIREPYQVPFNLLSWIKKNKEWVIGGAALIAILTALILWLVLRKPRVEQVIEKPKPKIPPHKTALKKLKDIEQQKLWQHGKTKQYHSAVSEIVREYIENRYGILALEATTPEILQASQALSLNDTQRDKLKQLLELSDLVKFAKMAPIASENELSIKNAIDFVESTRPQEKKND